MGAEGDIVTLIAQPPLFLPLFAMVLCRVSGLMMTAPIYGSQSVPVSLRAAFSVAIAVCIFPIAVYKLPQGLTLSGAAAGVFGELLIGLIMGLSLSLTFAGAQVAGMIIGQQAGMSLGQVFNPVLNTNTTILGQIFFLSAITVFVLAGGHRELMRALLDTYDSVPVMSFRFSPPMLDLMTGLLTASYTMALRLAAPVLISLLMATLAMGFLSRTMPQFNILSVGFAVRTLIAMGIGGFSLAASSDLFNNAFVDALTRIREAFGLG